MVRPGAGEGASFELAVITPRGRASVTALPKGHIDHGETALAAATREVREETGLGVQLIEKLGDVRYVYRFRGKTIFKVVSFFLFKHLSGEIDQLSDAMRVEVDRAHWIPLADSKAKLSYPGEREMVTKAQEILSRAPTAAPRLEPLGR